MTRLRLFVVVPALCAPALASAAGSRALPVELRVPSISVSLPAAGLQPLAAYGATRVAFSAPLPVLPALPAHAAIVTPAAVPVAAAAQPEHAAPSAAASLSQAAAGAERTADASDAGASALLSSGFDGAEPPKGPEDAADVEDAAPELPAYLSVPDADHARWVASVVAEASTSRTGRAVLARAERLAAQRGRPVLVTVAPIGNAGEYSFDYEIVTIDKAWMKHDAAHAAPVFIHELLHVLQLAQSLPADAFEMELEAYLAQFRVGEEMGLKVRASNSFHWRAFRRFKNDVDRFIVWLKKEYPNNLAIVGDGLEAYETKLIERHLKMHDELERLEKRRAKKQAVLDRMKASGQPEAACESYRLDEVAPIDDKIRVKKRDIAWAERDLAILRDPEARARYQAYAARVLKKARAYHARLARS